MKIEKAYNGWPAAVRTARGKKFYAMVRSKKIPAAVECFVCGLTLEDGAGMTYHAEEYGPTWEEYVEGAKPLCAYCHMMMHMRFRYPNRFKRYRGRIRTGWMPKAYANIGVAMKAMLKQVDIPYQEDAKSGIPWFDAIEVGGYKGDVKIATTSDGMPDPLCYPELQVKNDPKQYELKFEL